MLFLSDRNISKIEDISYKDIVGLYKAEFYCTDDTKSILIGHAARMMAFFAERGLFSRGYSILLDSQMYPHVGSLAEFLPDHRAAIEQLRPQSLNHSAQEFYDSINGFVWTLQEYGYVGTTIYLARHLLTALYLFLEIHELGYLPEIAWIWFSEVQNIVGCSWRHWRRALRSYEEYHEKNDVQTEKKYRYEPSLLESLPQWCREPIIAFQKQKLREFRSEETVDSYQYPCIRFCLYLIARNISVFDSITTANISEFCRTDRHDTFKGRSSYFTVVRHFLEYLEEIGLIHNKSLHNSLSAGTAPVEEIVDTLTDEQISRVNDYRLSQKDPIELRNSAMVMVGLRMGLRASDVVNLMFDDIDWKKRQITIIQQKTQTQITLPMTVDVGNSIYSYLKNGRPKSSSKYIFIRHKAPYCKLTIKICTKSLHCILPERKAVIGGGFHVTRRTFATRLLRNNAGIETVIDSLGHQDHTSIMAYLSLDEERMQSCALSLSNTGLLLKRGGLL
jgi:site-specific recombinase XerD